jgi:type VI secretion system protein ImpA
LNVEPAANGKALPTMVELEACCMDCEAELLPTAAALLAQALDHAQALDALLAAQLGTLSPDLSRLVADVQELKKFVDTQLARRFPELAAAAAAAQALAEADTDTAAGAHPTENAPAAAAEPVRARGIQGSEDVLLRIDELCEYYDRNEPSSPVPILLRRARRLVGKGFEDVLRNIAPGGLSELQMLLGPDAE